MRKIPKVLFIILIIRSLWIVVNLSVYLFQDLILYSRQSLSVSTIQIVKNTIPNSHEIFLDSDGVRIHGWLVQNSSVKNTPLLIYFGGQGDEISSFIENSTKLPGCNILSFNYRGYGLSQGTPNEQSILYDSLVIYDYIKNRKDIPSNEIFIMGRSLGTGVAVFLAQHRPAKAVILISPYDSITSIAQEKLPFIPVAMLNKNQFDSLSRVNQIHCPLLAIIATNDLMIPPWHSKKLLEKWPGSKTVKMIQNVGHNDLLESKEYWTTINNFIRDK